MKKILSIFCFMCVSCAYTADLGESSLEDEMSYQDEVSYLDNLVRAMDKGLHAARVDEREYVSFFLIDALPTALKPASSPADIGPIASSKATSQVAQKNKMPVSRCPIFDSFVGCAFSKDGAEIIDKKHGKIRVNDYYKFLKCVEIRSNKNKKTNDAGNRIKSIKRFIVDWPKKSRAVQGNFTVSIKQSVSNSLADLARFHELIEGY